MTFICYPRCTTCRKAQKWLDANGFHYEFRDIKENNPTVEELREWHLTSDLPLRKFWNTSGQKYRAMSLSKTLPEMSPEQQYELMATDGLLVKRPIFLGQGFVLVGFKEEDWKKALKPKGDQL